MTPPSGAVRTRVLPALTLLALAGAAAARDLPSAAAVRAARDEVFARPELRAARPDEESAVLRGLRAFGELLTRFQEQHPTAFVVLVVVLAATALLLIAHLVWTVVVARSAAYDDGPDAGATLDVRRTPAAEFRARAVRLAGAGRLDDAARELYSALLAGLAARGDVAYARHKVLLDYRLEARADDARAALALFAGTYLPSSFGRRPLAEERFAALLAAVDRVLA